MKTNLVSMKRSNQSLLIDLLKRNGPTTKAELSRMAGLAGSTVTRLVQDLISEGILVNTTKQRRESVGRKGDLVSLNGKKSIAVVVDVGINESTIGIAYLNGNVRVIKTFPTTRDFKELTKMLGLEIEEILHRNNLDIVSMSIPGIVDREKRPTVYVPSMKWFNQDFSTFVPSDTTLLIENEALLSMLAEFKNSEDLSGIENAAFIFAREGISTGIMLGGRIIKTNGRATGSFAHTTVDINSRESCYCGNTGCWELFASVNWPINKYGEQRLAGNNPLEKFRDLLAKSREETEANEILRIHARNIAVGAANIANAINAQLLIVGGILTEVQRWYLDEIENTTISRVIAYTAKDLRIRSTRFLRIPSSLVGAAENAAICYLENRLK